MNTLTFSLIAASAAAIKSFDQLQATQAQDQYPLPQYASDRYLDDPKKISDKMGLISNPQHTPAMLETFKEHVSWTYNYSLTPTPHSVDWINDNGIEFVSMIHHPESECDMRNDPDCTVDVLVDKLRATMEYIDTPITKLMGFNEPYNDVHPVGSEELVELWRKFVQPTAQELNLDLVTFTTKHRKEQIEQMSEFLHGCHMYENDAEWPCDVDLIKYFSVHYYRCAEKYWFKHYGPEGSMYKDLIEALDALTEEYGSAPKNWAGYIRSIPIMLTETNCNWDGKEDIWQPIENQCERITGQVNNDGPVVSDAGQNYGLGSVHRFMEFDNFSHFAWWNPYNQNTKNIWRMQTPSAMDKDGNPTAIGRALLNGLDPELADCRAESSEVTLSNGATVYVALDGGYYDKCTFEYLGHETVERRKDKQFELERAIVYEEGCP